MTRSFTIVDESNTIVDESIAIIFESIATAYLMRVHGLYVRSSPEWTRASRLVFNTLRAHIGESAEVFIFRFYLYARYSKRARLYAGRRTRAGGGYFYFWFRCLIASYNHSIHAILFTATYLYRDPELFTVAHFTDF